MTQTVTGPVPTGARPRRGPGRASLTLLGLGGLVAGALLALIAVAVVRHLSGTAGPVLPQSLCRAAAGTLAPLAGRRWLTSWQFDAVAVAGALGAACAYLAGVAAVHRRRRAPWPVLRTVSFLAGLAACVLATTSAVGVYDMAMFSAHMLGHLAFVMVAPPLLVAGRPLTLALHATTNPWHSRIKRVTRSAAVSVLLSPPVAFACYTGVIVGTHLTGLMDVIMRHAWAGQIEHLVYLLVGYQFFSLIVGDEPIRWRLTMLARQGLLAVAMAVDTFTGVILLQTPRAISMSDAGIRGLDPLTETHLGGAIMWVGGDGIMAVMMVLVLRTWVRRPSRLRRESRGFLERARSATFSQHTDSPVVHELDDNEAARQGYNDYLRRLQDREPTR